MKLLGVSNLEKKYFSMPVVFSDLTIAPFAALKKARPQKAGKMTIIVGSEEQAILREIAWSETRTYLGRYDYSDFYTEERRYQDMRDGVLL